MRRARVRCAAGPSRGVVVRPGRGVCLLIDALLRFALVWSSRWGCNDCNLGNTPLGVAARRGLAFGGVKFCDSPRFKPGEVEPGRESWGERTSGGGAVAAERALRGN